MWVLKEGRKSYLELLRNLSMQFVLAVFFLLVSKKAVRAFEAGKVNDGASLVFIAFVLFSVLGLAIIANLKNFFTEFSHYAAKDFNVHRLNVPKMGFWMHLWNCTGFLLKNCKLAVVESVFMVLGIYLASLVGLLVTIESVSSAFDTDKLNAEFHHRMEHFDKADKHSTVPTEGH